MVDGIPLPVFGARAKLLSWSAVAAFAVMLAFACLVPYARKETVPG